MAAIFFALPTIVLAVLMFGVCFGATALGAHYGRRVRHMSDSLSESFGVLQGAMLGVVGLILAFGLSLALSRYEDRRDAIVTEANAIEAAYLRAQALDEPARDESIEFFRDYVASDIRFSEDVLGSDAAEAALAEQELIQRDLWAIGVEQVRAEPEATGPRLYLESLNEVVDAQKTRAAALANRVPDTVLLLEMIGAAIALGLLATYVAMVGRGSAAVVLAALLVGMLLYVTADLDRPTRGLINVPDQILIDLSETIEEPPAAPPPKASES